MKYKLLATDMDGTLLDDNKQIDECTRNIINKAISKGLIFVIASGRPIKTLRKYLSLFDNDIYVIAYNGSLIQTSKTNKIIFKEYIEKEILIKIVKFLNDNNKTFIAWQDDNLYCNVKNAYTDNYQKVSSVDMIEIKDYNMFYNMKINKVIMIDSEENIKTFMPIVNENLKEDCTFVTSQAYFLEFMKKGINKASSLAEVCKILDIKRDEVIAIGDGFNDLDMLQFAHLNVAPSNACEEIKGCVNYVTSSNNNGGVRKVIEKFVLGEENERK